MKEPMLFGVERSTLLFAFVTNLLVGLIVSPFLSIFVFLTTLIWLVYVEKINKSDTYFDKQIKPKHVNPEPVKPAKESKPVFTSDQDDSIMF